MPRAEGGRNTDNEEQEVIYSKTPPATNDLGARRDVYVLGALLLGPNYVYVRNALLAELYAGGKGTLGASAVRHLGSAGEDWAVEESTEEGGLVRFTLMPPPPLTKRLPCGCATLMLRPTRKGHDAVRTAPKTRMPLGVPLEYVEGP